MIKLKIGVVYYYVGDGVEMRRLWKKAVKAGFSGYKGDITPPKYDIKGTYAIEFISKTMFWSNFKTIAKTGSINIDKLMPDYRKYSSSIALARGMYEFKKENR